MNRLYTLLAVAVGLVALALAPGAQAQTWMQVSCVNPDGSAAPNSGWTGFAADAGPYDYTNIQCGPGMPMVAALSAQAPAPALASEFLGYTPPSGSTLVGGTVDVNLYADGYNAAGSAAGVVALFEPQLANSPSDYFFQCEAKGLQNCPPGSGSSDYSGQIQLPPNRGGTFTAQAGCLAATGESCEENAPHGAWAMAQIVWAHFLLSSNVSPEGSSFTGSALQRNARGTAHLVFTAADPGGPGVYSVTVSIDGRAVWSGVPNGNSGACVPVGTDSATGALMFDSPQPCLPTEVVDVPVPTTGLPDGAHELSVTVTDAARNSSTVLDQTITTSNPQTTPVPRSGRAVHARFIISWSWTGNRTTLRSIEVQKLTSHANVAVRCLGRGCPRLKLRSAGARHVGRLLRALGGRRFRAGDRLRITVTARGRSAERIELRMRDNQLPQARLLKR
jgi:hypothetical protein